MAACASNNPDVLKVPELFAAVVNAADDSCAVVIECDAVVVDEVDA